MEKDNKKTIKRIIIIISVILLILTLIVSNIIVFASPLISFTFGSKSKFVRLSSAIVILFIGKPAVKPLIEVLRKGNDYAQELSAASLGVINDSRAVYALIGALTDKNYNVRLAAALALGLIKDERSIDPLIACLKSDYSDLEKPVSAAGLKFSPEDKDQRADALRTITSLSLAGMGKPAMEQLVDSLNEENWYVKQLTISALKEIADKYSSESLYEALGLTQKTVASTTSSAWEKIREIQEPLAAALHDENIRVQEWARSILAKLKDDPEKESLGKPEKTMKKPENKKARQELHAGLKGESTETRIMAAVSLAGLGDSRGIKLLISLLSDKSDFYRLTAAQALGELYDKRALAPLRNSRKKEENIFVKSAMTEAIRRIMKKSKK